MAEATHKPVRAPASVIGHHGCARSTAEILLSGADWIRSENEWDWLGSGVYFWEYAPFRARDWARRKFGADAVVLEVEISLGRCLNLLYIENSSGFEDAYQLIKDELDIQDLPLPRNHANKRHELDRVVVDVYCGWASEHSGGGYQTVRGCYPEGEPLFVGSKILSLAHTQVAVRDTSCISQVRLLTFD